MKTWMYPVLGLLPNLLIWNYAYAGPPGQCDQPVIVRAIAQPADAGGNGQHGGGCGTVQVMAFAGDGAELDGEVEVVVVTDGQAGDGRSQASTKKINVIARSDENDPDAASRGWLGVMIQSVPEAMAAQLGNEDRGIMIGSVVPDSPADKAGLEAHDIIVDINGEEVAADVGPAVDLIKARKPGETINVGILRAGQPLNVPVTLGSRADMKNFNWTFQNVPGAEFEEHVKTRGKFIMRGPEGEIVVKDLGELDDLKNLPDNVRMFVPQAGSRSAQVMVQNGQKTVKMNVSKDGSTIAIEQEEGGPITVSRTDDAGQETVATYDSEDALQAGDEEAYEIYSQAGQTFVFHHDADGHAPHIFLHGDDAGQWRMHLEQSLSEAREAYDAAMEELHEQLMEMKESGTLDIDKLHGMLGGPGMGRGFSFHMGKPRHTFSVNADGSISATIRKGDSEMVQNFRNENDLANRRPDLYEKFQAVQEADQD